MPTWSPVPPPSDPDSAFSLLRTPADRPLAGIVTSHNMIGCETHYWGGRTVPCEAVRDPATGSLDSSPCPACRELQGKRWHGYLAAYNAVNRTPFIFEFTQRAAVAFQQYFEAHGTLRGCAFQASRPKPGPNTRVEIITKPADLNKWPIPQPPNLIRAMSVIWRLPTSALHSLPDDPQSQHVELHQETLKRMRGVPPQPEEPSTDGDPPQILAPVQSVTRTGNGRLRRTTKELL